MVRQGTIRFLRNTIRSNPRRIVDAVSGKARNCASGAECFVGFAGESTEGITDSGSTHFAVVGSVHAETGVATNTLSDNALGCGRRFGAVGMRDATPTVLDWHGDRETQGVPTLSTPVGPRQS